MAGLLIAAALATAALPSAPARPDADPAIWVVNDSDTVIFLFGTFHALDGKSDWFNDEVRTAFSSSDQLVLETVIPDLGKPLPMPSSPQIRSLSIAPTASFLATTRMVIKAGKAKGINVAKGADMVLSNAALAAGKPIEGLESFDEQLALFSRMPGRSGAAAGGAEDPRQAEALAMMMSEMQKAWNRGDQGIFTAMLDQMRSSAPETYRMMFTARNDNWASWIKERLNKPGTVFVAVGAGHLAGQDSVQAKLAERGVHSARIN